MYNCRYINSFFALPMKEGVMKITSDFIARGSPLMAEWGGGLARLGERPLCLRSGVTKNNCLQFGTTKCGTCGIML